MKVTVLISLLVLIYSQGQLAHSAQATLPAHDICEGTDYRIFDRLLGNWEVYGVVDDTRTHLGNIRTQIIARGCAIKQVFTANQQGSSHESLAILDGDGAWTAIFVADDGQVSRFRWHQNEEELIRLKVGEAGAEKWRLVTFDISQDQYSVLDERSSDYGQSWAQYSLVQAVRKASPRLVSGPSKADPAVEHQAVEAQAGEDSALEDVKQKEQQQPNEKEADHEHQ